MDKGMKYRLLLLINLCVIITMIMPIEGLATASQDITEVHDKFLPLVFKNASFNIEVTENTTNQDGVIGVRLSDGATATFQVVNDSGKIMEGTEVIAITDSWGVSLIVAPPDDRYFPTITSVETISLTQSTVQSGSVSLEDSYPVVLRKIPDDGVLVIDSNKLHIEHLFALPSNSQTWENEHATVVSFFATASGFTTIFLFGADFIEEGLKEALKNLWIHIGVDLIVPDLAEILHINPAQEHLFIVNREKEIAIDVGSTPDEVVKGIIFGQVVDEFTNVGIPGAAVRLDGNDQLFSTTTLDNGWYQF
ncbi:hypothetical protein ACFLXI_09300, partial [Chloroflexota bacterium]